MYRLCALFALSFLSASAAQVAPPRVDFKRDVQPILRSSCLGCHTGVKAGGQWRLDSKALAMKGGISGPVIVPGNSAKSRLLHRLLGHGGEKRMPLGGPALSPIKIAKLRRWIDAGAPWPDDPSTAGAAV